MSVAAINDKFRQSFNMSLGKVFFTQGIILLGDDVVEKVIKTVKAFNDFDPDEDGSNFEHDFGCFDVEEKTMFWKIDYYRRGSNYSLGSSIPEDISVTERVLTVMLAEEY